MTRAVWEATGCGAEPAVATFLAEVDCKDFVRAANAAAGFLRPHVARCCVVVRPRGGYRGHLSESLLAALGRGSP